MAKKVKFGLSTAPRAKPKKRPGRHKKSPNKHEKRMGKYRRKQLTLSNKVLYLRYKRNKQKGNMIKALKTIAAELKRANDLKEKDIKNKEMYGWYIRANPNVTLSNGYNTGMTYTTVGDPYR